MARKYFRAPVFAKMPHLLTMLDDIGDDKAVARFLGLSQDTMRRYRKSGQAPRPVMYALYWETQWGIAVQDCELHNGLMLANGCIASLRRKNEQLQKQVAKLEALLATRPGQAANQHFFQ